RQDSPCGRSPAQPAYLELWEVGLANLGKGETGNGKGELESWLTTLYQAPAVRPELFESYLHDAPLPPVPFPVSRRTLSWWSLLFMTPQLPRDAPAWSPGSVLLESQGLAVLRTADRYVRLESGQFGAGRPHPRRRLRPRIRAGCGRAGESRRSPGRAPLAFRGYGAGRRWHVGGRRAGSRVRLARRALRPRSSRSGGPRTCRGSQAAEGGPAVRRGAAAGRRAGTPASGGTGDVLRRAGEG